jgi:hypothetical protein
MAKCIKDGRELNLNNVLNERFGLVVGNIHEHSHLVENN